MDVWTYASAEATCEQHSQHGHQRQEQAGARFRWWATCRYSFDARHSYCAPPADDRELLCGARVGSRHS